MARSAAQPQQPVATAAPPPERAPVELVERQVRQLARSELVTTLLASVGSGMLILNEQRQIVAANEEALQAIDAEPAEDIVGQRLGEALRCAHAELEPDGCGSSPYCSTCGLATAIVMSRTEPQPAVRECLLACRRRRGKAGLEVRVKAVPMVLGEHQFTVVTLVDISAEKRRAALERTFLHDLLNTVGGLLGWSKRLPKLRGDDAATAVGRIGVLAERLNREIQYHRQLLDAETGTLAVALASVQPNELLRALGTLFEADPVARNRSLAIVEAPEAGELVTDAVLLLRILTNMVKNALEATGPGGTVRVWFERADGSVTFKVWNAGEIPPETQAEIFRRSFSTKGEPGRGLGTYAMKLFGEDWLGGSVRLSTSAEQGTVFSIALPPPRPMG